MAEFKDDTLYGSSDTHMYMMEWEKDYMETCINLLEPAGDVLEIGFGYGYSATQIQQFDIKSHTILEPDEEVYKNALEWAKDYPKAKIIKQAWPCTDNLGKYDCFFHDPYIEDASEELLKYNCTNIYFLIKCIKELANKDSRFSFFCSVNGENNTIGQYFDRLQRILVDECPDAEYKISVYQYDSTNVPEHCNYTREGWLYTPLIQVQQ